MLFRSPTNEVDEATKAEFYQSLEQSVRRLSPTEVVHCLGDFNAATGTARDDHASVVGPYGSRIPNDNTDRLLNFDVPALKSPVRGSIAVIFIGIRGTPVMDRQSKRSTTYLSVHVGRRCRTVVSTAVWNLTATIDQWWPRLLSSNAVRTSKRLLFHLAIM